MHTSATTYHLTASVFFRSALPAVLRRYGGGIVHAGCAHRVGIVPFGATSARHAGLTAGPLIGRGLRGSARSTLARFGLAVGTKPRHQVARIDQRRFVARLPHALRRAGARAILAPLGGKKIVRAGS